LLGGVLAHRLGYLKALFVAGLLAAATNLTYSLLAVVGQQTWMLAIAVISDNLTSGLVTVAFVAYISSLCNVAYTATQYSLLSSLGNLSRIWLSASSGYLVDRLDGDWVLFFIITAALALIGLPLLWLLIRRFPLPADAAQPGPVSPRPRAFTGIFSAPGNPAPWQPSICRRRVFSKASPGARKRYAGLHFPTATAMICSCPAMTAR